MKFIRNTMQRPNQWTVIRVHKGREHLVGTYATQLLAQQAAWPVYEKPSKQIPMSQMLAELGLS